MLEVDLILDECMARTKRTKEDRKSEEARKTEKGNKKTAKKGERIGRRAQTTSYRKSKELGRVMGDSLMVGELNDEAPAIQAPDMALSYPTEVVIIAIIDFVVSIIDCIRFGMVSHVLGGLEVEKRTEVQGSTGVQFPSGRGLCSLMFDGSGSSVHVLFQSLGMARKKSLVTWEEASVGNSRIGEELSSRGRTTQTTSHRKRKAINKPIVKRARNVRVGEVEEDHSHIYDGAKDVESDVERDESSRDEDEGGNNGDDDSEEDVDNDGDDHVGNDANEDSDDVGDGDDDCESDGKGDGNDDRDSEKIDKIDHGKRVIAKTVSASAKRSEIVRGKKVNGKIISAKTISAMVASNKKDVAKKGRGKKKARVRITLDTALVWRHLLEKEITVESAKQMANYVVKYLSGKGPIHTATTTIATTSTGTGKTRTS
ncbi:hypothetical protein Sjap_017893 [Stephania japonica]|uniref:Uncharacterized protein n=1 Tax=Stephania japonica TaxID=461633 RepID=A0AAP0I759_9MAGN